MILKIHRFMKFVSLWKIRRLNKRIQKLARARRQCISHVAYHTREINRIQREKILDGA